jgi:hypothetical protein
VEGSNIKPLLADPKAAWPTPGVCTFGFQNHTARNEQWRYIRYADGGEELYNHKNDPYEWTNLASRVEFDTVRKELAKAFPTKNVPEASPAVKAPETTADGKPSKKAQAAK